MASLVDELNDLLSCERGEAEAVQALVEVLEAADTDLADGARDVLNSASWACSGLYHRISQLGGTPTLQASNLAEELEDRSEPLSKLKYICSEQHHDVKRVNSLLKRNDLDTATRELLTELRGLHNDAIEWCSETLKQWRPGI